MRSPMGRVRAVLVEGTLLSLLLLGVDTEAQDELFVANACNNSIPVYSHTQSGNSFPIRTLARAATDLAVFRGATGE